MQAGLTADRIEPDRSSCHWGHHDSRIRTIDLMLGSVELAQLGLSSLVAGDLSWFTRR